MSLEDTALEIHRIGHRQFIGGDGQYWDTIGALQFQLLLNNGLSAHDVLLDIACGSLRGGSRFVKYLQPGNYLGIEKHIELLIYGVSSELGLDTFREKQPRFVVSDSFQFEKFEKRPTFAIAQSLFTHLSGQDIALCLRNLRGVAAPNCKFLATFFEVTEPAVNPLLSHSIDCFYYTRSQMEQLGAISGWRARYVGEWGHPRGQKLMIYEL